MEPTYSKDDLEAMKGENRKFTFEGKEYDGYTSTQAQRRIERTIRKLEAGTDRIQGRRTGRRRPSGNGPYPAAEQGIQGVQRGGGAAETVGKDECAL